MYCAKRYTHNCVGVGEKKFGCLCGRCFAELPDSQRRAILDPSGGMQSAPAVVMYPRQSRALSVLAGFASGLAGAASWTLLSRWMGW